MNHATGIFGDVTATPRASGGTPRPPSVRRAGRKGFTLTEIMIALGVLVTGMSMVAAALQAGLQNHTRTVDDIVRTLVAENGLAEVKARLVHTGSAAPTNLLTNVPTLIKDSTMSIPPQGMGPADRRSPYFGGMNGTFYGYCVLGWRATGGAADYKNDYCFSIVPYKIGPGASNPQPIDAYKTDYVDIYGTGSQQPLLADFLLPDGSTVTKITLRTNPDKVAFPPGAVVLAFQPNIFPPVLAIGVVDKLDGTSSTAQLKSQLLCSDGKTGITGSINLWTLSAKNGVTNAAKGAAGQPDPTAAVTPLKPYMARTALTPYQ